MKKIRSFIKYLILGFTSSLDHKEQGFSQKKIIGYGFFALVIGLHASVFYYQFRLGNFSQLPYVLGTDSTFLAALCGLNLWHEIQINKNGNSGDSNNTGS